MSCMSCTHVLMYNTKDVCPDMFVCNDGILLNTLHSATINAIEYFTNN